VKTIVYIDGFNLYYRALKDSRFKWLDLGALFQRVLSEKNQIVGIKYFTAKVSGNIYDPGKPTRQQVYLRALARCTPPVEIYYGHFLSHEVNAPLANPGLNSVKPPKFVRVIKTEEKGSDVNLATHLLNDAWLDNYDCGVVVSNDSDIAEAMRLVKTHQKKCIGVLTPGRSTTSEQLRKHADFVRRIREGSLRDCQFPDHIPGTRIHKPKGW
jgi:uncharacterized LabA/DUF88 family protein